MAGRLSRRFPTAARTGYRSQGSLPVVPARVPARSTAGGPVPCRFESDSLVTGGDQERAEPKRPGPERGPGARSSPPQRGGCVACGRHAGRTYGPNRLTVPLRRRDPPVPRRTGRRHRPVSFDRRRLRGNDRNVFRHVSVRGRSARRYGRREPCADHPASASACVVRATANPARDEYRIEPGPVVVPAFRRTAGPRPRSLH